MLDVQAVTKRFGGLIAVNDVSLSVRENEIVGLIGPNGAGKTTLFNVIAGTFAPSQGAVHFQGRQIDGKSADEICVLGLARTFQIPHVFTSMTVGESIMTGAFLHDRSRIKARHRAEEVAQAVGMVHRLNIPTTALTTAERKRLEVARALATGPSMILLDEVMAGLNNSEVNLMLELISSLRGKGLTVLFVEHNLSAVLNWHETDPHRR